MKIPQRVLNLEKISAPILSGSFGPLQGIRVLSTGSLVAVPQALTMLADLGAEVIHAENPGVGDPQRMSAPSLQVGDRKVSSPWSNNARNRLTMELDVRINKNPKSRELFLSLIKVSDIWMENLVWLEQRYGISDELVLETNPKIVIVHESGYGKPEFGGVPNICWRAAYDIVGQAYGGLTNIIGDPTGDPMRIEPFSADYVTAIFVALGALMGYISAQKTGKGQVVDVSQFESIARIMGSTFPTYLNTGVIQGRTGNKHEFLQPYGIFPTVDGYVTIGVGDIETYKRFLQAMITTAGINPADYPAEECSFSKEAVNSLKGRTLDKITTEWVQKHNRKEVNALLQKYQVPCSLVYDSKDAVQDAHWIKRGNFVECIDQTIQQKIKVFGVIPKASETPGKVWRGAPYPGQDTDNILSKILDYTPEEIQQLRAEKIVCR